MKLQEDHLVKNRDRRGRWTSYFGSAVVFCLLSAAIHAAEGSPAPYAEPKQLDAEGFQEIFAEVAPGVFMSGQPDEAGLERVKALGVTRVINLRTHHEMDNRDIVPFDEAAAIEALGLDYVHIPSGGPDTPYSPAQVEAFANAVEGADRVLVHCTVAFRATHMWTAYLISKRGVPFVEAIDIARQLNLGRMPLEGFLDTPLTIEPKS